MTRISDILRLLRAARPFAIPTFCVSLFACTQTPPAVVLHSMRASGNTSFVCWGNDAKGYRLEDCPDPVGFTRHLYGLVTQVESDEVAVVDVSGGESLQGVYVSGHVVDEDQTTPGYTFLRVGGRPGAIASTPGGTATFVAVSGLHKNGIFALPSTCLAPALAGESQRDLTTWSACALSSAPGDMTVLIDDTQGSACPSLSEPVASTSSGKCWGDLSKDAGPSGRRLLAVALPSEQRIAVIDAQSVLNGAAGEFSPCVEQASIPLTSSVPAAPASVLPADLQPAASCSAGTAHDTPVGESLAGGFALAATEKRLYVADRQLPIVHVLDVSQPCAAAELAPLRATSYADPTRTVTTSRVAVSPLTPAGRQFVYAVDDQDQPASVMVFDVSPSSSYRGPLVLPGAPREAFVRAPDRISYSAPVRDVAFALRDFPASDPTTGVGLFGELCDPNPNHPAGVGGTAYEPNPPDFNNNGARPGNLRGLFGFAMMTSGQIGIIDVEDFDAPCRRPGLANSASLENFQGCAGDDLGAAHKSGEVGDFVRSGLPTVSGESSCRMVEPHHPRSLFVSVVNQTVGVHAPSLRSFPQFLNPSPGNQLKDAERPHLFGVNFPNPAAESAGGLPLGGSAPLAALPIPAQVIIGITGYSTNPTAGQSQLDINPASSTQNSIVLPLNEPRAYAFDDNAALTYEGKLVADRRTGFLSGDASSLRLTDADAQFCVAGVEDATLISGELSSSNSVASGWAEAHADYLQITGDFPPQDAASYWSNVAATCSYNECINRFGKADNPLALAAARELRVTAAYDDHLELACRGQDCANADAFAVRAEKMKCCFPSGTAYVVRASQQWVLSSAASGVAHDIEADPAQSNRCVHRAACEPLKKYRHGRVFEICDPSSLLPASLPAGASPAEQAAAAQVAATERLKCGCLHDFAAGPVEPNQPGVPSALSAGSECIFENPTARFALYRARTAGTGAASVRDMAFSWQVTGGFAPLAMNLAGLSPLVDPHSLVYLPRLDVLAVTDGAALGLSLLGLDTLGVLSPSPFF